MTGREVLSEVRDAIRIYESCSGTKPGRIYISNTMWNVLWSSFGRNMKYKPKRDKINRAFGIEMSVDPALTGDTLYVK